MENELKMLVLQANKDLVTHGLVLFTWGNVSAIDRKNKQIVIKPSGIDYNNMTLEDLIVVDYDGKVIEGTLNPSVDLPTHLWLYKKFDKITSVVHTHSTYATAFAQANQAIIAYGTTHADSFYGDIPCSRALTQMEVETNYEANTGKVIVETFDNLDPNTIPACLVAGHGVFAWGISPKEAVYHAAVAEQCAKLAFLTESINLGSKRINQYLLDKHFLRKNGKNASYGQRDTL